MTASPAPPVDPDLMALAWEILSERSDRARKRVDVFQVAVTAWCEFMDLTEPPGDDDTGIDDAEIDDGVVVMRTLALRMVALVDVLAKLEPGSYPIHALTDTAATAPLLTPEARPSFQFLDFVARVERAAREPQW